jgi:hypothetical protein
LNQLLSQLLEHLLPKFFKRDIIEIEKSQ